MDSNKCYREWEKKWNFSYIADGWWEYKKVQTLDNIGEVS